MATLDRLESIDMAIQNEKAEMKFFLHEARRTKNPLAHALFRECAKDESKYIQSIKSLRKRLQNEGQWPKNIPIEIAGSDINALLDELLDDPASAKDQDDADVIALEKAIDFEKKGMLFYSKLMDASDNPMEKKFFKTLATMDREHYLSLNESLEYLRNPEVWMSVKEKPGLDGA